MKQHVDETTPTFEAFTNRRKGKPVAAKYSKEDNRRNFNKLRQLKRSS